MKDSSNSFNSFISPSPLAKTVSLSGVSSSEETTSSNEYSASSSSGAELTSSGESKPSTVDAEERLQSMSIAEGNAKRGDANGARKTAGSIKSARTDLSLATSAASSGETFTIPAHTTAQSDNTEWDSILQSQSIVTPPGALNHLPGMTGYASSLSLDAPWVTKAAGRTQKIQYDWASFVYAYSRGKWDPSTLPLPPSQSNVYPGENSRIGYKLQESDHAEASSSAATTIKRPSIDYTAASGGKFHRLLSDPADKRIQISDRPLTPPQVQQKQDQSIPIPSFINPFSQTNENGSGSSSSGGIDGNKFDHASTDTALLIESKAVQSGQTARQSASDSSSPLTSSITAMRPALAAQISELSLSASHTSRGKEAVNTGEARPIPLPLQQVQEYRAPIVKKRAKSGEIDSPIREASVEDKSRRQSEFGIKMPTSLAQIGPSNSSPGMPTYIDIGKRIETFFKEKGFLPAITPPDEADRRRALRRYGPPTIRGDSNFERIAHLVKLVFNTKLVLISLVGDKTQYFQTEIGAQSIGCSTEWLQEVAGPRDCSMCAHAILQDNDEPLIVLDAQKDWRFAGNPLVVDDPKIRFYAGAPLRTADGFNLGSLCIIDNHPWTEFTPRHRHTLREFARVVMREMELQRDTIHLQTQDRMQHSIESFTRKCIEMDTDETDEDEKDHSHGSHQVYSLAAKSMRDALEAEGAIIFDLSQFEMVFTKQQNEGMDEGRIFFPSPYQFPEAATLITHAQKEAIKTGSIPDSAGIFAEEKLVSAMPILGSCELHPMQAAQKVPFSHYLKVAEFLRRHRTGFFYPFTPATFKHLLPMGTTNVLLVPIFGLNRQPFALLCAYSRQSELGPILEDVKDPGLQYLRAMGTIILSAILKKDIMLADQAKSHFISNISHELRTPLHGILAAAELLTETKLDATQDSYLETVEACGKSLLELVNHVLDFTKLSGDFHTKQAANKPSQRCDLVKLIQEVCESSWIGQMAKNLESSQHAGIGSAYAKGSAESTQNTKSTFARAEMVIDVSMRSTGWLVKCDAGGIRRVLMNLIGNSLKFTTQGFVHVSLREVQSTEKSVLVELGVTDTGKGISKAFLEEQLFHPFTQENHLGPGTGLGLSIVNSIVQSPAINGKIDVWSTVGQGTEIRVTCELELDNPDEAEGPTYCPVLNVEHQRSISLLGFDDSLRGQVDLKDVLQSYYEDWWRFQTNDSIEKGDLILINEDAPLMYEIIKIRANSLPPIILLTSERGNAEMSKICIEYEAKGGVVRFLFKPAGPAKLEAITEFCLQCFEGSRAGMSALPSAVEEEEEQVVDGGESGTFINVDPALNDDGPTPRGSTFRPPMRQQLSSELRRNSHHVSPGPPSASDAALIRRHSHEGAVDEDGQKTSKKSSTKRPLLPSRSITYHEPNLQRHVLMSPLRSPHGGEALDYFGPASNWHASDHSSPSSPGSVISLDGGEGAMLRSAISTAGLIRAIPAKKRLRILSVEDNSINRRVLAAFFSKMEVDLVEATNGEEGVQLFKSHGPFHFDVIFMDLSMPVLDGIGAMLQIRKIEADRWRAESNGNAQWMKETRTSLQLATPGGSRPSAQARAKIFALTGRSSDDDKRRAFANGADGFIVKPLSYKVLTSLIGKISAYK